MKSDITDMLIQKAQEWAGVPLEDEESTRNRMIAAGDQARALAILDVEVERASFKYRGPSVVSVDGRTYAGFGYSQIREFERR